MKFTKEKLTVPGWYWVKLSTGTKSIVSVTSFWNNLPDTVYWHGQAYTLNDPWFSEFAGPIEQPEE